MISYIKGLLISKNLTPNGAKIVVDVNNIGYTIVINKKTLKELPAAKTEVCIYTSLIHKEDSMVLCGFLTPQERETFNVLQTVSGIGMKAALLILELPLNEIISAVMSENEKVICQIKGIGPKLAKRLILELKDKMTTLKEDLEIELNECNIAAENFSSISNEFSEAQAVLNSLGYTKCEISLGLEMAAKKVQDKNNTQEILQIALGAISGS